jgi:hypothetical protein
MDRKTIEEQSDNLNFLLNTSDKSFYDWAAKMDDEDLFYAECLLKYHLTFIHNRIAIIKEERKMNVCSKNDNYYYSDKILNKIVGK